MRYNIIRGKEKTPNSEAIYCVDKVNHVILSNTNTRYSDLVTAYLGQCLHAAVKNLEKYCGADEESQQLHGEYMQCLTKSIISNSL